MGYKVRKIAIFYLEEIYGGFHFITSEIFD